MSVTPPVSGIVFLPTGSGKTRIGIEHMARVLQVEPEHRFVWATYSRSLIQQTLQRLEDYGPLFKATTNAMWLDGDLDHQHFDEAQILFMTRERLKTELDFATNWRRSAHPVRDRILEGRPTTLIYDECHQLGAAQLQEFLHQPGIRNVPHHDLTPTPLLLFFQIRPVSGVRQFVQNHRLDLGPRRQQVPDIVRPDKSAPARHQNNFTHQSLR